MSEVWPRIWLISTASMPSASFASKSSRSIRKCRPDLNQHRLAAGVNHGRRHGGKGKCRDQNLGAWRGPSAFNDRNRADEHELTASAKGTPINAANSLSSLATGDLRPPPGSGTGPRSRAGHRSPSALHPGSALHRRRSAPAHRLSRRVGSSARRRCRPEPPLVHLRPSVPAGPEEILHFIGQEALSARELRQVEAAACVDFDQNGSGLRDADIHRLIAHGLENGAQVCASPEPDPTSAPSRRPAARRSPDGSCGQSSRTGAGSAPVRIRPLFRSTLQARLRGRQKLSATLSRDGNFRMANGILMPCSLSRRKRGPWQGRPYSVQKSRDCAPTAGADRGRSDKLLHAVL